MDRRTYLKSVGAGSLVALAGCSGDGGDGGDGEGSPSGGTPTQSGSAGTPQSGQQTIVFSTSPEVTTHYSAFSNMGGAINSESDEIFLDVRPVDRTGANLGALDREEADIVFLSNFTTQRVQRDIEPFDDVGFDLVQIVHSSNVSWFPVTNEDMTSVADIGQNTKVSMAPRGSQIRVMMNYALHQVIEEGSYTEVSSEYGNLGSDMNEDRVDVVNLSVINPETDEPIEGGFNSLVKDAVDANVLHWPDDAIQSFQEDPLIAAPVIPLDQFDGYNNVPDEYHSVSDPSGIVTRPSVDYDTIYAFLENLYEYRDRVTSSHAIFHYDDEDYFLKDPYPDVPFHAAAADFYEEIGIWNDDLERAE